MEKLLSPAELKIKMLKAENERLKKKQEDLLKRNKELKQEMADALRYDGTKDDN